MLNFIKLLNNKYNKSDFQNECCKYTINLLEDFFKDIDIYNIKYFIWILDNDFIIKKYLNFYNNINIDEVKTFLYNKINSYEIIYLKPDLNQLYNSFIYKLEISNNIVIIPLWHKEVIFNNYIIKIEPKVYNNIQIDENNNLHYYFEDNIYNLITKFYNEKTIPINIHNIIKFNLPIEKIILKDKLKVIYKNFGLPKINTKNILDNSIKADIIIHIKY